MALTYKVLDAAQKASIKSAIVGTPAEPAYEDFLPTWEAEHYAHTVLLEKAIAEGNDDEAEISRNALATLEKSVTNVRAGKRPDGTDRTKPPVAPTPPAPPAP